MSACRPGRYEMPANNSFLLSNVAMPTLHFGRQASGEDGDITKTNFAEAMDLSKSSY